MEVLSPAEICSIEKDERDCLQLPLQKQSLIIPIKEEKPALVKGALFQKICSSCETPSKYQCPKCSILSCSVACVKKHKEEKDCDGIREKTAFVSTEDFKDQNLHSDYHFLEDIQRNIDVAHRAKKGQGLMHGALPHNLYRLQMAARHRKTDLHILPLIFTKRKRSTTYLRYGDRKIFWRLEWQFPHSDYEWFDERVDEETLLADCVNKYVNENSPDTKEKLSYYHALLPHDIIVLLKDENCPANVTQYHMLIKKQSLKSNFKHKKIIEYPTLLVISKVHLSSFQITV